MNVLNIAALLGEGIKRIHGDESVSGLVQTGRRSLGLVGIGPLISQVPADSRREKRESPIFLSAQSAKICEICGQSLLPRFVRLQSAKAPPSSRPFLFSMAIQLKINAQLRTESGRNAVKKIKQAGFVPAVIYGAKDPARNLQINEREVSRLLGHTSSESVLVEVRIQGGDTKTALIQEVQHHPVTGAIMHLDLHAVSMDELLTAEVAVETVGEAAGVKTGGVLEVILRTLEIECLPGDLPETITVDVSALEIGDAIHVGALALPKGVTVLNDASLTVVSVAAPTVVEETAPSTAEAGAQPEVINEKKSDTTASAAS